MNIFQQIKSSVYGKEYYKDVVSNMRLSSSIKYLAKFCLLIVALGVVAAVIFLPTMSKLAKKGITSTVALYPDDLEVTIAQGKASINQPEPYFIKGQDGKNLVVVDTKSESSISKFREYGAFAMLSATEIIALKDTGTGQLQVMPLPKEDVVLTKALAVEGQDWLINALPWIFAMIILIGAVFLFLANFVGSLIVLFIYALAIWVMSKVCKWNLSYKKSYQVGIHAMTLVSVLSLVALFGVYKFFDNFFLKLIVVLVVTYINLRKDTTVGTTTEPIDVEVKEVTA